MILTVVVAELSPPNFAPGPDFYRSWRLFRHAFAVLVDVSDDDRFIDVCHDHFPPPKVSQSAKDGQPTLIHRSTSSIRQRMLPPNFTGRGSWPALRRRHNDRVEIARIRANSSAETNRASEMPFTSLGCLSLRIENGPSRKTWVRVVGSASTLSAERTFARRFRMIFVESKTNNRQTRRCYTTVFSLRHGYPSFSGYPWSLVSNPRPAQSSEDKGFVTGGCVNLIAGGARGIFLHEKPRHRLFLHSSHVFHSASSTRPSRVSESADSTSAEQVDCVSSDKSEDSDFISDCSFTAWCPYPFVIAISPFVDDRMSLDNL